jgi:hypothetical protein
MSRLTEFFRSLLGRGSREAGPRRSGNGASSFHLVWEMPARAGSRERLIEVSAVLEVTVPPREQALHFWALQVDLADGRGVWGGAHTGLQWNKRYPGGTAVNWGGYKSPDLGGAVLRGTFSSLPGFPDDPNTLGYAWEPGSQYRLRVFRSPDIMGAWRAEITDLESGLTSIIRDLLPEPGRDPTNSHLGRPIVWSEVFAPCDAPSVAVRWSDLAAVEETGTVLRPAAVRVNYQASQIGGCTNTTVLMDEAGGLLQVTNAPRTVKQDARLVLPGAAASR